MAIEWIKKCAKKVFLTKDSPLKRFSMNSILDVIWNCDTSYKNHLKSYCGYIRHAVIYQLEPLLFIMCLLPGSVLRKFFIQISANLLFNIGALGTYLIGVAVQRNLYCICMYDNWSALSTAQVGKTVFPTCWSVLIFLHFQAIFWCWDIFVISLAYEVCWGILLCFCLSVCTFVR